VPKYIPVPPISSDDARLFLARVDMSAGPSACWPWKFGNDGAGYGRVKLRGIAFRSHRVAYYLGNGGVDAGGKMVCHRCDNPRCCNPAHLFLDDHSGNMADMVAKGRARGGSPAGENAHNAKLSAVDLEKVRAMILAGSTNKAIGRVFGVTHQAISRIRRGRSWGSEPMQPKYQSLRR
jgi:hypothetical protein